MVEEPAAAVGNVVRCRPTTSTMPDPTSQWGVAPPPRRRTRRPLMIWPAWPALCWLSTV